MMAEALLILSILVLGYTYVGYPLILRGVCALRLPRPLPSPADAVKAVSAVVCVRNAEQRVAAKIENLRSQCGLPGDYEIIVASDGSTDGTVAAAREAAEAGSRKSEEAKDTGGERCGASALPSGITDQGSKIAHPASGIRDPASDPSGPRVRVIEFREHRGKAAVLNDVIPQCRGEVVVLTDVRQELALDAIQNLCRRLADPAIGAVSGELVFKRRPAEGSSAEGVDSYWRYEKAIRKMESCVDSTCGCTGAIYAIRRSLYRPIHPDTVLDDVAIPMRILMQGKRIVFEEAAKAYDEPSSDLALENRRKIRTLAGNFQLFAMYGELLNPLRNRIWIQFVSHKLLRLFCPWFLLLCLGTSGALALNQPWAAGLFQLQLLFYGLAAGGMALQRRRAPRVLSVPAAFVSLNWAAALGTFRYLRGNLSGRWD